jgi:hypothetical protein
MDRLIGQHSAAAVRKALENLPKEVDDTYDEAIQRIEGQAQDDRELAKRILAWITFARRPLNMKEFQNAMAVAPGMTSMDDENIIDEDILTSLCAGLVVMDGERTIVRLVRAYLDPDVIASRTHAPQTILRKSTSNASEISYFQMLRQRLQQHVSHISHSTSLAKATAPIISNLYLSWKPTCYSIMLLITGVNMCLELQKKLAKKWY